MKYALIDNKIEDFVRGSKMKDLMFRKTREVFGEQYELDSMERILGGAQKHTYLAKCTNGFEFVIYQWDKSMTYFENNDESAVFCSSSPKLFKSNNELMREHGVLTPELFYMDISRNEADCEYAFAEYINGHDMDYIMEKEPERLPKIIKVLKDNIDRLHSIKSSAVGQVGRMQGSEFNIISAELEDIHQNCQYLQANDAEYTDVYIQVEAIAKDCAEKLEKRNEYTFIHGELGPNHVIVDKDDNTYLIDIEGAKFYDVEEELSFLNMRFNKMLNISKDAVDEQRMHFYYIGHCLGNLRGAVELRQKGFYDMDDVNGMIEFFHKQVIEIISKYTKEIK